MVAGMRHIFHRKDLCWGVLGVMMFVLVSCGGGGESIVVSDSGNPAIELSATVDRAVAEPGDIITFAIRAEYQPGVALELPEVADRLSDFRIVDASFSQPVPQANRLITERSYKLQADISGSYVIEPIEVTYDLPDGKREAVKTPKIFIEIESMLAKDGNVEDIRDIKPPLVISYLYRMIFSILGVLCACILAVLLIRKLVEWRTHGAEAHKMALKPAHEEALEALEMLLNKRLVEKGRMRKFCFEISMIFRRYMQARFGIPALDLTTEEIIPRVEENGILEDDIRQIVREFLVDTDMVKFAKYMPSMEEMETILRYARTFIERTRVEPAIGMEKNRGR